MLDEGPTLGEGHQAWQMNEINKLIWPAGGAGIGVMNSDDFELTADIAKTYGIINDPATDDAYMADFAENRRSRAPGRRRRRQRLDWSGRPRSR